MTTPVSTYRNDPSGLRIADELYRFVEEEALPGSGVDPQIFWPGAARLFATYKPLTRALLARRDELQAAIDDHHRSGSTEPYEDFLRRIGYLADVPDDFEITTGAVDPEVSLVAGPQLAAPLLDARFATNAANARWGSLYDALYGSDAVEGTDRRAAVVVRAREFLDTHVPLAGCSHGEVDEYLADRRGLVARYAGGETRLADEAQYVGRADDPARRRYLLRHHGLHIELVIDRTTAGRAGLSDVVLESAVTTIMDLEDTVVTVDAEDKVRAYRNWLLLMQGRLSAEVTKDGRVFTRSLAPDRRYLDAADDPVVLPGRALLFIRHVGHHRQTDAVLDRDGDPVPEGLLDALVTTLGSLHDLRRNSRLGNSRTGSVYAVKPKLHGPAEVALTCRQFADVERLVGLAPATIKLGLLDEERRTSVNLKACILAAADRIAFVTTGFPDRTGDEIHTSMHAGPVVRKNQMRAQPWFRAYERNAVAIALACGFSGRAQIGKGMWNRPDRMAWMLADKVGELEDGATCAGVHSPAAATLHATHYHQVDVWARHADPRLRVPGELSDLLTIPTLDDPGSLTAEDIDREVENNLRSALGYVARWVDAGVGCAKVPAITGTNLLEDRATCRISTQYVANWLLHGVVTGEHVEACLQAQRTEDLTEAAFRAVHELVFSGATLPSGYVDVVLHRWRRRRVDQAGPVR
ncbi:malate synthase G [Cryptosporangium sp. NPDC051539]|uniref:malate synthase G n=1 Tax=Cryptosporangium sp. NPDC051539 TaxID=3363962 RepID=UPI0037A7B5D0